MQKKVYIFACIIILIVSTVTYSVSGVTLEESLQERKNEITNKIDETNTQLEDVQLEIGSVSDQIQKLNDRIANYQQEIAILNIQVSKLEKDIEINKHELQVAEANYIKQKELLEKRVVAMYEAGETFYLDVLLSSKTIEDFISKYYVLSEIARYDRELLDNVTDEKQKISAQRDKLTNQQEELKTAVANKEKMAVTLTNTKTVRNNYLNQLTDKEKELQEKVEEFEEEMENLEYEILNASLANFGDDYAGGEMAWPTPGYKTITSKYGMRMHPIFNVYRMHTGVDIGAPLGANIIAVNDGVVTLSAYSSSYGYYVMIDHGGGVVTLYAHASKLVATEGDIVKKGDVIALVGSTGWSTGPHLHFEVRINGKTQDPLPYITGQVSTNKDTEQIPQDNTTENESTKN